jgi:predicted RNase H-like nuclease
VVHERSRDATERAADMPLIEHRTAGVDGTPNGWAVVISDSGRSCVRKVGRLSEIFDDPAAFAAVAIDIPIGLLDAYEAGGRSCDRAARRLLGRARASSVFPAPVRPVLGATSYPDACTRSRASAPHGKAISKQTFNILDKIKEVDDLLHRRPELRQIVREVHPEVSFAVLAGKPMIHKKATRAGQDERRRALLPAFPDLAEIEEEGHREGLPIVDILDATVACWSARRIARRDYRTLPDDVPRDSVGLPMAIWI